MLSRVWAASLEASCRLTPIDGSGCRRSWRGNLHQENEPAPKSKVSSTPEQNVDEGNESRVPLSVILDAKRRAIHQEIPPLPTPADGSPDACPILPTRPTGLRIRCPKEKNILACQRRCKIRLRGGAKPGQVAAACAMARALTNSWRVPWRIGLFGPKRAI